ncbi:MAG TPA: aminotransferase class V-fold PLP-dependent enzyme [Usitatibacter sp.]|jgi:selenocysteine lyase/cysteine desulfurase|nr:aminotransferase class V-fold PLP-dependent enzyme [Usitatibacter sp.]
MHDASFSRYRAANPGRLHFAAHSHHPWPDATEAAHARYWTDSATLADRKWERVLGEVLPAAQDHVARKLSLSDARQVAFAPNTHEFVVRLYSCLEAARPLRVLTTAHEFHSFRRQTRRLQEAGRLEVREIALDPWETFDARFAAAAAEGAWDLVWISHVFFDSGFVVRDLDGICAAAPDGALVAIDGYHAFCAIPVDLSRVHRRAFYLAGGYKYAMSGEGACFLAVPPGNRLRPVDTGWYAAFDRLADAGAEVPYADDAFRFWGATFDASGLYRFVAAMDWLDRQEITIADVHRHATLLHKHFLDGCARRGVKALAPAHLMPPPGAPRGNFLAFALGDAEDAYRRITAHGVTIDRRGDRLRFGFGLYHDEREVERLVEVVARALT